MRGVEGKRRSMRGGGERGRHSCKDFVWGTRLKGLNWRKGEKEGKKEYQEERGGEEKE